MNIILYNIFFKFGKIVLTGGIYIGLSINHSILYSQTTIQGHLPANWTSSNQLIWLDSVVLDSFNVLIDYSSLVDIDDDGDMDIFTNNNSNYYYLTTNYYENVGFSSNHLFIKQDSSLIPLSLFSTDVQYPSFVDIDNDGDMDCFVNGLNSSYGWNPKSVNYYQNVGTNLAPYFIIQPSSNNPLDLVNSSNVDHEEISFVDIDNDGDQDAFLVRNGVSGVLMYENTGTASTPSFVNLTTHMLDSGIIGDVIISAPQFFDIDNDNDEDVFFAIKDSSISNYRFYENIGSSTTPDFVERIGVNNPFSNLPPRIYRYPKLVDLNRDGSVDIVDGTKFFESILPCGVIENSITSTSIEIFPNPTNNHLSIHYQNSNPKKMLHFSVLNALGQELTSYEEADQSDKIYTFPIQNLASGVYFLEIRQDGNLLETQQFIKQ